ncbi:DUF4184 family protein [Klenkia taihuensis]|uniref:DUF4184 family protein n=1 Tax=Klenkia taihuensis TaxID=1225127 RepID=A0A1I1UT40_9ACTN|nr:DUF4184 family protein [Klenkia taihuensis]GHE13886.1 hypothetical protein GCM10011381_37920 [Klenkia taihuensis]SFD73755.1 protein of unknown function [Klenkia taihuensis]
MPFTLSHPAAVLPFLRSGLPASALVAGSVVPDLPYYLPVDLGVRTHTALAVVTTDLVGGLLLWAVWHGFFAAPLVATAPGPLRARLPVPGRPRVDGARGALLLAGAVLLGAATHVLWDEFTHPGRWGPEHIPALSAQVAGEPLYGWLQDLSGLVGGLAIGIWVLLWWRRTPPRPVPGGVPWGWLAVALVALVSGAVGGAGQDDVRSVAVLAAFAAGTAALVAGLLLAAAWHLRGLARSA